MGLFICLVLVRLIILIPLLLLFLFVFLLKTHLLENEIVLQLSTEVSLHLELIIISVRLIQLIREGLTPG